MKPIIAEQFKDDSSMLQWLTGDGPEKLKQKYPPPKFKADLYLVDRKVIVVEQRA